MEVTPIDVFAGDDEDVEVTLFDADGKARFDLTGMTLALSLRESQGNPQVLVVYAPVVTAAVDGEFVVSFLAADIPVPDMLWYRLRGTRGGKTRTLAAGPLRVAPA